MKPILRLFLLSTLLSLVLFSCQQAPGPMTPEQKEAVRAEVRPAVADLVDALEKRDLNRAMTYFSTSPEAAFVLEGRVLDAEAIRARGKNQWPDVAENSYDFQEPKVSVLSPDAVLGTVEGMHTAKDTLGGSFGGPVAWTMVWVKEKEGWKMLQGHSSEPLVISLGDW